MFFVEQKTAYELGISDWSSDVCSSDLYGQRSQQQRGEQEDDGQLGSDERLCEAAREIERGFCHRAAPSARRAPSRTVGSTRARMRSPVERPEVTTTRSPTGSPNRTHRTVTRWSLPTTNTPVRPPPNGNRSCQERVGPEG